LRGDTSAPGAISAYAPTLAPSITVAPSATTTPSPSVHAWTSAYAPAVTSSPSSVGIIPSAMCTVARSPKNAFAPMRIHSPSARIVA
jgi:hypothetical protein